MGWCFAWLSTLGINWLNFTDYFNFSPLLFADWLSNDNVQLLVPVYKTMLSGILQAVPCLGKLYHTWKAGILGFVSSHFLLTWTHCADVTHWLWGGLHLHASSWFVTISRSSSKYFSHWSSRLSARFLSMLFHLAPFCSPPVTLTLMLHEWQVRLVDEKWRDELMSSVRKIITNLSCG